MNAFKLEAGLLHVDSKTNLSDHHAWQLTTFSVAATLEGFGAWCIWYVGMVVCGGDRERDVQSTVSVLNEIGVGGC